MSDSTVQQPALPIYDFTIMQTLAWQATDVVVSSGTKQGTTWLLNIVHQLRTGGDEHFANLLDECPWLEATAYPGQPYQERLHQWEDGVFRKYSFRIFKTHQAPPVLPFSAQVRYIVPVRNSQDTAVSIYHFLNAHTEESRTQRGGFPPRYGSFAEMIQVLIQHKPYWRFVHSWWPYRHEPNVMLLHFADLKRDPAAKIEQIAQFLGLTVAADKLPGILEKCSFGWMKAHGTKFEPPLVPGQPRVLQPGGMIRNGRMGESELWDDADLVAQWQAVHKSELPDDAPRTWCDQGGPLP